MDSSSPDDDDCNVDKTETKGMLSTSASKNIQTQLNEQEMAGIDNTSNTIVNNEGESIRKVGCEICLPFLFAGLGMVLAGALLDCVQHWPVFGSCPQLFILVPALLGLKV